MAQDYRRVAIVHHTYTLTSLVEEELRDYLLDKTELLYYLTHPFKGARDGVSPHSRFLTYSQGELKASQQGPAAAGHEILFFVRDILSTLYYFLFRAPKIDLYVGVDNLNAFVGILLKRLGRVDTVVYYVIDYVPHRFSQPWLNRLYHWVDRYCVKAADQTWNLGAAMVEAREAAGLAPEYRRKQQTVPVGTHILSEKTATRPKLSKERRLVFLGIVNREQGVELLIPAMLRLRERFTAISLTVIGSGPLLESLREQAQREKLDEAVTFHGFVPDNREVEKILQSCHLGLAPYEIKADSFKHFTDPGKIKTYLGAGLPVVMTRISHIAQVIESQQAGIVTESSLTALVNAIETALSDEASYQKLQHQAQELARDYDWQAIFATAFAHLKKHEK